MLIYIQLSDADFERVQSMKDRDHLHYLSPQEYLQKKVEDLLLQDEKREER